MVQGYQLSIISAKIKNSHLENPEEAIEQSYKSFRLTLFFINPQTIIIFAYLYLQEFPASDVTYIGRRRSDSATSKTAHGQ